jgi:predicted dehydrogenase
LSEKSSLALGVIGCGSVAENAYLPLIISLMARGKVQSVCFTDVDPARALKLSKKINNGSVAATAEDILADKTIDIVVILTSMTSHSPLARAALLAGKHVLVEKPMAISLEDGKDLLEVAARSPGHLVCAPHVLLSPDYQEMHRRISSDGIGKPLLARARYGWNGPDWGKWFYAPGGGPLFDLGVYNVTSLTGLLGPAKKVSCLATLTRPTRVVDGDLINVETNDTFQIIIEHEGGVLSTVTTAFGMQKYRGPAIEIYGLEGTIQMMGDDWAPDGLEYWSNELNTWQVIESHSRYWPWTDGLAHLVDSVLNKRQPYTRPEHAFHVLEIMLAAMESAESGQSQSINSTFEPPKPIAKKSDRESQRIHDRVHEDAQ